MSRLAPLVLLLAAACGGTGKPTDNKVAEAAREAEEPPLLTGSDAANAAAEAEAADAAAASPPSARPEEQRPAGLDEERPGPVGTEDPSP